MVQGILKTLSSSVRGLHQAAYLLAGLTLASQILALIRDRIFAHEFGAGATLDLYYAAFKVPDLVFALVGSLVSAYVLIPRIAGADKKEVERLLAQTISFLLVVGGILCAALALFAPQVLAPLFPALMSGERAEEFVLLARLLLIQPLLLGLSGILGSVTQVERKFFLFALSPVLYNLGIIFGTVALYPALGLPGIGAGVIIGAIAHLFVNVPSLIGARVRPRLTIPSMREMTPIILDSIPRSLALSMTSVIALALASIASRIGEGAVSIFTLAGNLEAVPLSLIGASYATAAFPVMAEQARGGKIQEFKDTVSAAARHIIFWSTTAAVLVIVLRAHLVRVILGTGAFDWDATRLTAATLAILVVGLVAQGLTLLCARAFYASKKSWNPFIIQLGDIGVSVAIAWGMLELAAAHPTVRFFIEDLFRAPDLPETGVLFVALGATIGQLLVATVALITLRTVAPGVVKGLGKPLFEGIGAAVLGGAAAYEVLAVFGNIVPLTTLGAVFTEGLVAGMVGLAVAASVLILLENREFADLSQALGKLTSKALRPSGTVLNEQINS